MQTGAGNEEGRLEHDPNGRAEEQHHEPSRKTHRNRGGRVSALREQSGARRKPSQQRTSSVEAAAPAPGPGPPELSPAPASTFPQPAAPGSRSPDTYLWECSSRSSRLPPAASTAQHGRGRRWRRRRRTRGGPRPAPPGHRQRGAAAIGRSPAARGRRHRLRIGRGRRSSASPRPRLGAGAGLRRGEPQGDGK